MCCASFPTDVDQNDKEQFFDFPLSWSFWKLTLKLFDIKKLETLNLLVH